MVQRRHKITRNNLSGWRAGHEEESYPATLRRGGRVGEAGDRAGHRAWVSQTRAWVHSRRAWESYWNLETMYRKVSLEKISEGIGYFVKEAFCLVLC